MEHDEDDLVGQPIEEVPKIDPDDECNARRSDHGTFLGYCNRTSGWGTDGDSGRCRTHNGSGGAREGAGAPEHNDNAADHELYSDENAYYQRRDEANQTLIDAIYDDYYKRFETRNGEPITGDEAMLFKVAVSVHKLLKADDWIEQRPETLDSGHPLIDRSEKRTAQGESYYEYVQSAVMKAEKQLEGFIRRWLKANDLHGPVDDGADVEVEVTAKMWDDLTGYYDED